MSNYYNENFGVNAVQSEFTVDNPTFDEKVDRLKRTYAAGKKFYDEQESKINKSEKDAIRSNYGSRTAWTLGGATVGAGAGYLIGRQWAKKDPVISQQRKKKLVGTLSGAILGAGAGYGIKRGLERWGSDDIRKSYSDARSELSNKRATLDATYKSKMDDLHEKSLYKTRAALLFTVRNPSTYAKLHEIDMKYHGDENNKPLKKWVKAYHNTDFLHSEYNKIKHLLGGISESEFVYAMEQGMWSEDNNLPQDAYAIAFRYKRKPMTAAQHRRKYNYHKAYETRLKKRLSSSWKSHITHGFNVGSSIGTTVGMGIGATAGALGTTIPSLGLGTAAGAIYGGGTGAGFGYGVGGGIGVSLAVAKRSADKARLKYHQYKLKSLKVKH